MFSQLKRYVQSPQRKCIIIFILGKKILFGIIDFSKNNCRFTPDPIIVELLSYQDNYSSNRIAA